jgi:hypothetical protein
MTVPELLAMKDPKFRDFMALKVGGKDEYSRLGYAALKTRMTPDDIAKVEEALELHGERAKVYRWILRGLPVDYAIRRVKTDLEVTANADYAREVEQWLDDYENAEDAFKSLARGEITEQEFHDDIHPPKGPDEITVGEFTLIRPHTNKVLISKDGEILAEKEINNDRHFENFLAKFRENETYRKSLTGGA